MYIYPLWPLARVVASYPEICYSRLSHLKHRELTDQVQLRRQTIYTKDVSSFLPLSQHLIIMSQRNGEKLREKAAKALHGPNANPSQLGDPISLKAETSDNIPKPDEAGASHSPSGDHPSSSGAAGRRQGETLREKATKKLKGPDANPSQLGDPVSLKAEAVDHVPAPSEEGAHNKRTSKL